VTKYSLAFLAGNVLLHQFSQLNTQFFLQFFYAALLLVFILFILGYFSSSYHYKKIFHITLFLSIFFFIAFFSNYYHANKILENAFPETLQGREIVVQGYIDSIPSENDKSIKFNFKLSQIIQAAENNEYSQYKLRVRLSWYKNSSKLPLDNFNVGDFWQFKVKLKRPHGLLNSGGMDYEKWLFSKQIRALGYIRDGNENQHLLAFDIANQSVPIKQKFIYVIDRFRQNFAKELVNILANNDFKGVYLALILGVKEQITAEQWKVFLDSGTNHLIAISGLHIGLFAAIGFFIGKGFWSFSGVFLRKYSAQQIGAVFALIFALTYAALAGFSIPTQRALIMISLALSALFFKIYPPPKLILSYTLIIVLLIDPMASLSIGFWLSFTAVAVILYSLSTKKNDSLDIIESGVKKTLKPAKMSLVVHLLKSIGQLSRMQVIIFIGLLPFSLVFFSRFILLSPIANLVAVPWMSLVITPLVLFAALISIFSTQLSSTLFIIISYLMQPLWLFLNAIINVDSNLIHFNINNFLVFLPILVGLVLFFSFRDNKKRWLFLVLLFPLVLPEENIQGLAKKISNNVKEGQFKVSVLDVGQGLSVVIQTQNHVMVYDTGNSYSPRFDMATQVVIPFLRFHSIDSIDKLVLSHADHDHVGSTPSLLKQYKAGEILSGEPERLINKLNVNAIQCQIGQKWTWDQVEFEIIYPQETDINLSYKSNNRSCVLLVKSKDGLSLLLTGDIEKKIEKKLLDLAKLKNIDIIVAPHHGSKSSSSKDFLNWLKPKIVVFSNGYLNRYSFPVAEVLQRYQQVGSQLYSTENGMISIYRTKSDLPIIVTEFRKDNRHYWNRSHKALQ